MINTQGEVAGTALFSPYGKLLQSEGMQANMAYAGLYHHKETGLYLATYRGYNPFTARWLNRDPIEENGGLNLYEYVGGNPMSFVDFIGLVMVDSTYAALKHYVFGNGENADLGPKTQNAIINSNDQKYRLNRIKSGKTTSNKGNYGVNIEGGVYHVGDTPIHYEKNCSNGMCTIKFTSQGDGFWDPIYDSDGIGKNGEFGNPYFYEPFSWQETYPDPNGTKCN